MRVCYFGNYKKAQSRNPIIINGLRKNGVEVVECHTTSRVFKYPELIKKHFDLTDYDVMVVGFPAYQVAPLAKLLTKIGRKPLVIDIFFSKYEAMALIRKYWKKNSLNARLNYQLERWACDLADIALLDTNQHIEYFCEEFGVEREKFRRVFVGADDDIFHPVDIQRDDNGFLVLFHGSFIPGQGLEYIIKAAKILEKYDDIRFEIIGNGQLYDAITGLAKKLKVKNISFTGRVDYPDLPNYIARADVCLGLFGGEVDKARRVIANKVCESLAMKKAVITGDCQGVREALTDKKNCILCEMSNAGAIVDSILLLRDDKHLREKIAEGGYKLFKEKFSTKAIGWDVKNIFYELF